MYINNLKFVLQLEAMRYFHALIMLLFTTLLTYAQVSPADVKKIDTDVLLELATHDTVSCLIILDAQAPLDLAHTLSTKEAKSIYVFETLRTFADASQQHIKALLASHDISFQSLFIVNAIQARVPAPVLYELAALPEVMSITENAPIRMSEPVQGDETQIQNRSAIEWGIERINADDVWALGIRGQNVVVGGEDTGYDWKHPALKKQYRGYIAATDTADHNYNWHDAIHAISPLSSDSINPCGLDSPEPCDDNSHGTHTMGTMIGEDDVNQIGVAPAATWCGCRNMERGWGSPYSYLECFEWFLAPTDLNNENPDPLQSPHVINNSWSCPEVEGCDSSNWFLLETAVQHLRMAGVVVVVSAGNSGSGCGSINTPAAMFEGSFTVGATGMNDTIAGFSSRGAITVDSSMRLKPNISAPGTGTRSAVPGGGYGFKSGTSMAGPHVAGVVALMISANPDLAGEVDVIEDIIEQTAIPKTTDQQCGDVPGSEVPNNTYGFGRIDALAAVEAAIAWYPVAVKNENEDIGWQAFPNPVRDKLIFTTRKATSSSQLNVYDLQGRCVYHQKRTTPSVIHLDFDLSHLHEGIYFYQLMSDAGNHSGKMIKQ